METNMASGHEQLDVFRTAGEYVGWAYRLCEHPRGHRGYSVREEPAEYRIEAVDTDPDADTDPE